MNWMMLRTSLAGYGQLVSVCVCVFVFVIDLRKNGV